MSHFNVAVITKGCPTEYDIENLLEPYQEGGEGDISYEFLEFYPLNDSDLENYKKEYEEYLKSQEKSDDAIREAMSFHQYMIEEFGFSQNDKTKEIGYYGNPDAKWDWYSIGGRWENMLHTAKDHNIYPCNTARVKDLIFPDRVKRQCDAKRFWEIYVDGDKPKNEHEESLVRGHYYNKQYYLDEYQTKENYMECESSFYTFALIEKNGEWNKLGDMGWFGFYDRKMTRIEWIKYFQETVFDNAGENDYITIVDCHI